MGRKSPKSESNAYGLALSFAGKTPSIDKSHICVRKKNSQQRILNIEYPNLYFGLEYKAFIGKEAMIYQPKESKA